LHLFKATSSGLQNVEVVLLLLVDTYTRWRAVPVDCMSRVGFVSATALMAVIVSPVPDRP